MLTFTCFLFKLFATKFWRNNFVYYEKKYEFESVGVDEKFYSFDKLGFLVWLLRLKWQLHRHFSRPTVYWRTSTVNVYDAWNRFSCYENAWCALQPLLHLHLSFKSSNRFVHKASKDFHSGSKFDSDLRRAAKDDLFYKILSASHFGTEVTSSCDITYIHAEQSCITL